MGTEDLLFITWERHQRTRTICNVLGIELVELVSDKKGIRRYLSLLPKTWCILKGKKGSTVFVQSPSIVLAFFAVFIAAKRFKSRVVIDAHNEAIEPFINSGLLLRKISHWSIAQAHLTVVTNRQLAEKVRAIGGKPVILPDRIPLFPESEAIASHDRAARARNSVTIISTYSPDEPLAELFEAVRQLPDVKFLITGCPPNGFFKTLRLPNNLTALGFLPETEFWKTLIESTLIVDLSKMPDCLVCGAYEGIAAGTPLLLTANDASRTLFDGAAVFVENTVDSIVDGIKLALREVTYFSDNIPAVRNRLEREWDTQAASLMEVLNK